MSDISQKKFWCDISSIWSQSMPHFMIDFGSKYAKWCVRFTSATVWRVGKQCQFEISNDDSCLLMSYISHKKFWCNISSIWTQSCIILSCDFALKISKMMCIDSHLQPFEAWESCLFAISNPMTVDLLMSDISQKKFWCSISSIWTQFVHHFMMDFGSKYPKWCVWFTSANRLKRGKAVYLQFLTTASCLLMSDISQKKLWCSISSILNTVMHHFMMYFDSKYLKWCVLIHICNRLKRGKAVYFQFITMTVAFWCQISRIKSFGAIYPAFETQLCIILWWILSQNIQNDVFDSHMQPCSKRGKAVYLQCSDHDSCLLMSDISQKKFLCNICSIWNTVMHHFMIDFGSKYPKWCVWFTSATVWSVGKPVYLQFLDTDSCLLMSDNMT